MIADARDRPRAQPWRDPRYACPMTAPRHPPADGKQDAGTQDDDAALFRSAIGRVRELPEVPAPPAAPKPRAQARMAQHDEDQARSEFRRVLTTATLQAGDSMHYRRAHVSARVLQRLGRGDYAAQEELDLHGIDAARAEALLRRFLKAARDDGVACVRIIHGKGLHSDERLPRLKNLVDRVLRQRADVLAFHSAPSAQGGGGAVLVLLQRR